MGYHYDLISQFAKDKNIPIKFKVMRNMGALLSLLDSAKIDIIAYNVPATAEYKDKMRHCGFENITTQVLVQPIYPNVAPISDVTQLVGKEIYVEKNSKYESRLKNLNNELATWGYPLSITQTDNYEKNTKNLSAEAYKTCLYKTLKSVENSLANNKNIGEVYRNYVLANLKVSAAVLCAEKGLPISTIDDPYLYYTSDYAAYLNFIERDKGLLPAFWKDIKKAKSVYQYWLEQSKLNSDTKDSLHAIDNQEIKAYVEENMQKRQALSNQIKSAHDYVIAELDTTVSGSDILPAIISQHRGKAILIDFWATWCTPCMKSMKAILPLKKELSARKAEQLVKNILHDNSVLETIVKQTPEQIYLKDAAERLKQILGTNVNIKQGKKKSRIEIEFYNEADLDRLIDLLMKKQQSSSPRVIDFNV